MGPHLWFTFVLLGLCAAEPPRLRLGVPQYGWVDAQQHRVTHFSLTGVPRDCDLVFSLTLFSGRAKLSATDPTSWPMKVQGATNGLILIPKESRAKYVYLLSVEGVVASTYDLLAFCARDRAHPIMPRDGVALHLLCDGSAELLLRTPANFGVSLTSLTPRLPDDKNTLKLSFSALTPGLQWEENRWHAAHRQLQSVHVTHNASAVSVWGLTVQCAEPMDLVVYMVIDGTRVQLAPGYPFNGQLFNATTQYFAALDTESGFESLVAGFQWHEHQREYQPDRGGYPTGDYGYSGEQDRGARGEQREEEDQVQEGFDENDQYRRGDRGYGEQDEQEHERYSHGRRGRRRGDQVEQGLEENEEYRKRYRGQEGGEQQEEGREYGYGEQNEEEQHKNGGSRGEQKYGEQNEEEEYGRRHRREYDYGEQNENNQYRHERHGEQNEEDQYRNGEQNEEDRYKRGGRRGEQGYGEQNEEEEYGRQHRREYDYGEQNENNQYRHERHGEENEEDQYGQYGEQNEEEQGYRRRHSGRREQGEQEEQRRSQGQEGGVQERERQEQSRYANEQDQYRNRYRNEQNEYQNEQDQYGDENEAYRRRYYDQERGEQDQQNRYDNEQDRYRNENEDSRRGSQGQVGGEQGEQLAQEQQGQYGDAGEEYRKRHRDQERRRYGRHQDHQRRHREYGEHEEQEEQEGGRRWGSADGGGNDAQERRQEAEEREEGRRKWHREKEERIETEGEQQRERRKREEERREEERREEERERRKEKQERRQERREEEEERREEAQERRERQRASRYHGERPQPRPMLDAGPMLYSEATFAGTCAVRTSMGCGNLGTCPATDGPGDGYAHSTYGELAVSRARQPLFSAVRCGGKACAYTLSLAPLQPVVSLKPGQEYTSHIPQYDPQNSGTVHLFRFVHTTDAPLTVTLKAPTGTVAMFYSPVLTDVCSFPVQAPTQKGLAGALAFNKPARIGTYYFVVKANTAHARYTFHVDAGSVKKVALTPRM